MPQTPRRGERGRSNGFEPALGHGRGSAPSPLPRQAATTRSAWETPPERAPLPLTADGLPPPAQPFWETADDGLEALGLRLSAGARAAIDAQARLLFAWNQQINLTALRDPRLVARRHVLDSLSALPLIRRLTGGGRAREREGLTLLDLGSGAGYPGLPLAVGLPAAECALVDSVAKKGRFLSACAAAAQSALSDNGEQPPVMTAVAERAEDFAEEPEHRERWRIVVARAVGTLAEVVELAMPLVAPGGHVIAWKRDPGDGSLEAELAVARPVTRATGGGRPRVEAAAQADRLGLPGHVLVTVPKLRPTPYRFPRPPAERRRALT